IALTKFLDSFFVGLDPLDEFTIDRAVARADQSENVDRQRLAFDLNPGDGAQVKIVAHQLSRAGTDENIYTILPGQPFQARSQVHRISDHRRVGAFMRPDVADNNFAMVDADAHAQRHLALGVPLLVELAQFLAHPESGPDCSLGVFGSAETAHISP